jgi:hypothetical protein
VPWQGAGTGLMSGSSRSFLRCEHRDTNTAALQVHQLYICRYSQQIYYVAGCTHMPMLLQRLHAQRAEAIHSAAVCCCLQSMLLLLLSSCSPLSFAINCVTVCCIAHSLLCCERAVQRRPTNLQCSSTQHCLMPSPCSCLRPKPSPHTDRWCNRAGSAAAQLLPAQLRS